MILYRNQNRQIRPNFSEQELYSKSYNAPENHYISDNVLDAIQAIRDYYGVPIKITSSYRTSSHNFAIGGSNTSQHLSGNAIDWKFASNHAELAKQFYNDMVCKRGVYDILQENNIKGFGLYKTFIHIDDGNSPLNNRSQFTAWDYSGGVFGDVQLTTGFFLTNSEGCPDEEVVELFRYKPSNWFEDLFRLDPEEGIIANTGKWTIVAGISVFLFLALFIIYRVRLSSLK